MGNTVDEENYLVKPLARDWRRLVSIDKLSNIIPEEFLTESPEYNRNAKSIEKWDYQIFLPLTST